MTHNISHTQNNALHQEVWELLPWYVNGTLARPELQRVEAHLALCESCQTELIRCQELATAIQMADEVAWEPSAAHMQRLLERLNAAAVQHTATHSWWHTLVARCGQARAVLQSTPPVMRWAFAAQGVLVILLASVLVWRTPAAPQLYPTLSAVPQTAPRSGQHIRLVFADDITAGELRALLASVGGTITDGPSLMGVYTVAIPSSPPVDAVLNVVRAHQKVRLAEPVVTR
jgi:anti-sigma factor RsiW